MTDSPNQALVNVDAVEKVFHRGSEDIHVLKELHLKVPAGEFLALMGPSGSGKSTLLNLIGGLDRPTSGSVSIAGERVDELSDRKLAAWRARHIGFVFQLYNLLPVLTAERLDGYRCLHALVFSFFVGDLRLQLPYVGMLVAVTLLHCRRSEEHTSELQSLMH